MSHHPVDRPRAVRAEDHLDASRLDGWLKANIDGLDGEPEIQQYPAGASNLTYLVRYPGRELVLRRPPPGTKARSAHDMGREYRVQKALRPVFPYVPEMLALCADESVIGAQFYVMQRIEGVILRRNLPDGMALAPDEAGALCRSMIERLVELHAVDWRAAGLESLGRGEGYAARQIAGWSERYRRARTWNVMRGEGVMQWLEEHVPPDAGACVIHNDFRFDNLVLDPDEPLRIIGVLDWEMATIGDPLMDLGNSLAYWVEAGDDRYFRGFRRQPTHLPGMFTRAQVVEYYCERGGMTPEFRPFYEVYGLFRLAVIAQQIYYRYHHRQTRNPAFRRFWIAVNYLLWRCRRIIRRD